jgi:ribosomal protein L37E
MGYGSGRLPVERASKVGHVRLVEHEHVARLVRQFERIDTAEDKPVGGRTGRVDLAVPSNIRFVVTVDGGQAVIPNEIRRDKRIAFVSVCAMLIRREDITHLRENPVIDPRELSRMFDSSLWYHGAVLPLAGIRLPGETVKETIRASVDAALEYTRLYDVLNFLVSRLWDPGYDMNPATNPRAPHMDCRQCGGVVWLPRDKFNFSCPVCGFAHRLSDYLGIGEEAPETWAREEAAMSLRNALETLTLFHFLVHYWRAKPEALNEILFLKDGPLLLRAQLSRLVEPIRAFISYLRDEGHHFYLAGVEKNGELVDHLEDLKKHLPEPGDFFLPSVRYLLEEIAGVEYDPARYRNRVQYGAKIAVRLGPDHVIPMDVPTGEFLTDPRPDDLIGFAEAASVLAEMTSYSHDNALIPLKLVNDYSSISERPSGDILKAFAGNLFGRP